MFFNNSGDNEASAAGPSYTETARGYASSLTTGLTGGLTGVRDRAYEYYEYGENYPYFCGVFLVGWLFIFLSTCFIPVMPISPYKTANLFNMGCITILVSFAVLHGVKEYCVKQFICGPKPRNFFAIAFIACSLLSIYVSIIQQSFFLTLIVLIC